MARFVKCKACGESVDIAIAYKVVTYNKNNKPVNAYYCSQKEYEELRAKKQQEKEDKDKVYELACSILGYQEIINGVLFKEWTIWNKVATNSVIAKYLEENQAYLTSAISRLERKEFNRIRYLSAILKNKLGDYKPKEIEVKKEIPVIHEEHYETKFKPKERKGLMDFEEEYDE